MVAMRCRSVYKATRGLIKPADISELVIILKELSKRLTSKRAHILVFWTQDLCITTYSKCSAHHGKSCTLFQDESILKCVMTMIHHAIRMN